jgi:hypothetical protein
VAEGCAASWGIVVSGLGDGERERDNLWTALKQMELERDLAHRRLAAVEALADEWEREVENTRACLCEACSCRREKAARLRAALGTAAQAGDGDAARGVRG